MASLRGGRRTAPDDSLQGVTPEWKMCGWIYKKKTVDKRGRTGENHPGGDTRVKSKKVRVMSKKGGQFFRKVAAPGYTDPSDATEYILRFIMPAYIPRSGFRRVTADGVGSAWSVFLWSVRSVDCRQGQVQSVVDWIWMSPRSAISVGCHPASVLAGVLDPFTHIHLSNLIIILDTQVDIAWNWRKKGFNDELWQHFSTE